jgi:hypothetical protein
VETVWVTALIAGGHVEPKARPEHWRERTDVRERRAHGRNARIDWTGSDQSRRRMTPISFP